MPKPYGSHLLARNVLFNILGQGLPILVAFVAIPYLIHRLGTEKFGVLALAWVVAGYFNLFDLGLGRAIVRTVVQHIPEKKNTVLFQAVWSSFLLTTFLGIAGGCVLFGFSEWFTAKLFSANEGLHDQVVASLQLVAIAIPFVVSSTIFRGVLEAFQKFLWINLVQVPMGSLTYLLPLLISLITLELPYIIGSLVVIRIGQWIGFFALNLRLLSQYPRSYRLDLDAVREMLSFGFWISTSNLVQPFLSYVDRFLIGSLISVAAVAHYTAPMEMVLKLWVIPGAVISVIYPTFTAFMQSREDLVSLYERSSKFLVIVLLPICFLLSLFSAEILQLWISQEYAVNSGVILHILAIGIFANCLGFIPAAYLQAVGKPSIPAKLHVLEFPIYFGVLFFLLKQYGLPGVAMAWFGRVAIDSLLLHWISLKNLGRSEVFLGAVVPLGCFFIMSLAVYNVHLNERLVLGLAFLMLFPFVAWYSILNLSDQRSILRRIVAMMSEPSGMEPKAREKKIERVGIALALFEPKTKLFERQLRSLRAQSFENWICIVTCDSPVENLRAKPALWDELQDPRFRVVENAKRLGAKGNFERAVQLVTKESVDALAFCDQDDYWYPEKLQVLVDELNMRPSGSLVHCDMRVVMSKGDELVQISSSAWVHEDRQVFDQSRFHFLIRNCVTGAASLMDVSLPREFGKIPSSFQFHDHWFALVAACRGGVYPVNRVLYDYVQHEGNVVGVIPYQGLLYRPPDLTFSEMFYKARAAWLQTVAMARDFDREGLELGRLAGLRSSKSVGAAFFLFVVGLLHIRTDGPLARTCLIKASGRFTGDLRVTPK